jgi:hypothetical protein
VKPVFTAVSAFDSHYPKVHTPTWKAILNFVERNRERVRLFVFGGDNLDCGAISHHTKGKPLFRPRGQMRRDLDGFNKSMLKPIEAALHPETVKVWLTGNHEEWAAQLIEEQPELEGLLDFPAFLNLRERGWIVKGQGDHYKQGKLKWIHGDVLSGGVYAARKALDTYVENLMFGHFHTSASATKILPHSGREKWQSYAVGCVGRLDADYLKNRPTGWLNGCAITEFFDNGYFNNYLVNIFRGRFSYGGVVYGR